MRDSVSSLLENLRHTVLPVGPGASTQSGSTDGSALLASRDGRSGETDSLEQRDSDVVTTLLRSTDVVAPDSEGRLHLEPAFREAWRERANSIQASGLRLEVFAARIGLSPERVAFAVTADGFVATDGRTRIGCWPSDAAFLADLAAADVLDERSARWQAFERDERTVVLAGLRAFLEECPSCSGRIVGLETPANAWRSPTTRSVASCDWCGSVLLRPETTSTANKAKTGGVGEPSGLCPSPQVETSVTDARGR